MNENSYFYHKILTGNRNTFVSLKEQTLTKVAIQICQYSDFKKHILNTPKLVRRPDPDIKEELFSRSVFAYFISDQLSAICDTILPHALNASLMLRIWEIAVRMIDWYKEQEIRLEMTPQIADQFLISTDWTVQGTIDERKVAERLVQEESIPVPQRYRLACSYLLVPFIRPLWNQIPPKDRSASCYHNSLFCRENLINRNVLLYGDGYIYLRDSEKGISLSKDDHAIPRRNARNRNFDHELNLVRLWSDHLQGKLEEFIGREDLFWQRAFEVAVTEGQRTAVTYCWERQNEIEKQETIITAALSALWEYCNVRFIHDVLEPINENIKCKDIKNVGVEDWEYLRHFNKWCAVPEHYKDIFYFFFSQMSEEQKIDFFQNAFDINSNVLDCFYQSNDNPLKMTVCAYSMSYKISISKFWRVLPVRFFIRFFVTLNHWNVRGCQLFPGKYQDFDDEHLLLELLERVPEDYKTYLFRDKGEVVYEEYLNFNLILSVFNDNPFEQVNIDMIQIILQHATVEEVYELAYSEYGEDLCIYLIENRKLEILEWMLAYCSPEKEKDFKKKFLASNAGLSVCLRLLVQENDEAVNSLFQWGNLSEAEISEIKQKIFLTGNLYMLLSLPWWGEMNCLNKLDEYCLHSNEDPKRFKEELCTLQAKTICDITIESRRYQMFIEFLSSDFAWEKDSNFFSKSPFSNRDCNQIISSLVSHELVERQLCRVGKLEDIVKWLGSNPQTLAVDLVKEDVMLRVQKKIFDMLRCKNTEKVSFYLKWYLSDIKSAKIFKKKFKEHVIQNEDMELDYDTQQQILRTWDELMSVRLKDLKIEHFCALA